MLHDAMTIRLSNQGELEALQEVCSRSKSPNLALTACAARAVL